MLYLALGELVVIVMLALAIVWIVLASRAADEKREAAWREERYELQERIRAPERPPSRPTAVTRRREDKPPSDLPALAQIGTAMSKVPPDRDPDPDGGDEAGA